MDLDNITSSVVSLLQGQSDSPLFLIAAIGAGLIAVMLLLVKLNFASMRRTDARKLAAFYEENKQD